MEARADDEASRASLRGHRVLLVTDRPFLNPVDGSAHNYLNWLLVLNEMGCDVRVLSFDRESVRWTPAEIARLGTLTTDALILPAHGGRLGTVVDAAFMAGWRMVAGRRYLPSGVEAGLLRGQRARLGAFLAAGGFQSVVVNKLHTTQLIGRRVLRALPGRKIVDMHDNYPLREALNRKVLLDLARSDWRAFRAVATRRDLLTVASWAGQDRKLAEEAARLADFDQVVFNAREEAVIYVQAGVPAAKVTVLPAPRPKERTADRSPMEARPFQVGLIASGALSNVEGLRFLLRQVMPALRERGARLLLAGTVGRFAPPMPSEEGVALGWVEDVATFYDQVEVVVVPLLTGTGVSVKTMEAAAHGAAIVTTTVGMRGIQLQPGRDLLVADDAETFAASIVRVLGDAALRESLRSNVRAGLHRHHSREAFVRGMGRLLAG